MKPCRIVLLLIVTLAGCSSFREGRMVGFSPSHGLIIAHQGQTEAIVVVSPESVGEKAKGRKWERQAALDLVKYIEMISGARPKLADNIEAIDLALKSKAPVFFIGEEALKAESSLKNELANVAKRHPELRADGIVLKRKDNRIYLAGTNDDSHYYAVAYLLRMWGCRWYLPTEIGECIPDHRTLTINELDYSYAPPFEVRTYWIAWRGDDTGELEFKRRNMMNDERVPSRHCLAGYTKDLVPEGKTHYHVPIAEDATAEHVAKLIEKRYASGERIALGMEDGTYYSDSPVDKALMGNIQDKYLILIEKILAL